MTAEEIDNLGGAQLDEAVAQVMAPKDVAESFDDKTGWTWWDLGIFSVNGQWVPARNLDGNVAVELLDRLHESGRTVMVEMCQPGPGGERFLAEGGIDCESSIAAFGPTFPIAVARLFLRIHEQRKTTGGG